MSSVVATAPVWLGPMGVGVLQRPKFGGSKKTTFFRVKLAHGEVTNLANPPQLAPPRPKISPQLDSIYVAYRLKVPTFEGHGHPTTPIAQKPAHRGNLPVSATGTYRQDPCVPT